MEKKTILILVNHEIVIYNFRKELVEKLLDEGHQVVISSPHGPKIDKLVELGCKHVTYDIQRHGLNPFEELKLLRHYYNLMDQVKPSIVLSYTIKPNVYGGLAAKINKIPYVVNITGLGNAVQNSGPLQKVVLTLYRKAFSNAQTIFFQNRTNLEFFIKEKIGLGKHELLPGSGVNLKDFKVLEYPKEDQIHFVLISRVMKSKGIVEYLTAAKKITVDNPNVKFHICGFLEEGYEELLNEYQLNEIITYHGMVSDVREMLAKAHCIIHPSYHEGMSNVLLEAAACGRPILATNIPGCEETFDEGISGFGFEPRDSESLVQVIEKFLTLTNEEHKKMGIAGRRKIEKEFSRQIVVNRYLEEIEKLKG